jgi:hypothetical protein
MLSVHADQIASEVLGKAVVLDIGGWASPFNGATHVMDSSPYETRGYYASLGGAPYQGPKTERFTRATWIQRDVCDREPYPFADKSVDFVICSHTLEDVRDPIWVCSEMRRIARAGYIETPSRAAESSRGWESPNIAGLTHHRWLVEIEGDRITFAHKPHAIHRHWRYALPASYFRALTEEQRVTWLFWDGTFEFGEAMAIESLADVERGLAAYVDLVYPHPTWRLAASTALEPVQTVVRHMRRAGYRLLTRPRG